LRSPRRKDLTSADFSHRDLHSFYIAYKVMPLVLLDGSDLSLARFRCDNLELDNFASPGSQSAVVSGATFTGDDLGSADFQGSNLQNAHLTLVIGTPIPNSQRQTDSRAPTCARRSFSMQLSSGSMRAARGSPAPPCMT
jgi:Pentapeptide repeats (8 copies)